MTANILLILSALLGYIVITIILKNSKSNRILNLSLVLVIFLSITRLLLVGIAGLDNNVELQNFNQKASIFVLLILPLLYLYFKYLIENQKLFVLKDLVHILFLLFVILDRKLLLINTVFNIEFNYRFDYFFLVYSLTYNILIFLKLRNYVWNKKANLEMAKKQNSLIKKWTILLYVILNLFIARYFIIFFIEYYFELSLTPLSGLWFSALLWIILFTILLSFPELIYGYSYLEMKNLEIISNPKDNTYWYIDSKIKINNAQDQQLKEKIGTKIEVYIFKLNGLLFKNSYFRNPDFNVRDLALVLSIPKSHIKFVFKYHSKLSFSDYKKIARIQNSIELIENNYLATNTLESLSREVGFTSYNPFFTSFKDVVGKSPHQYISSVGRISN